MDYVTEELNSAADQETLFTCEPAGQVEVKNIKTSWEKYERRPTWCSVTSMELSKILGVSLQTINNWHTRGAMPLPMPRKNGQGNKNRFKIAAIRAWLEQRTEDEIHWEFINRQMGEGFETLEQAIWNAQNCPKAFNIEKPII